jgi:hypothetical protein
VKIETFYSVSEGTYLWFMWAVSLGVVPSS